MPPHNKGGPAPQSSVGGSSRNECSRVFLGQGARTSCVKVLFRCECSHPGGCLQSSMCISSLLLDFSSVCSPPYIVLSL